MAYCKKVYESSMSNYACWALQIAASSVSEFVVSKHHRTVKTAPLSIPLSHWKKRKNLLQLTKLRVLRIVRWLNRIRGAGDKTEPTKHRKTSRQREGYHRGSGELVPSQPPAGLIGCIKEYSPRDRTFPRTYLLATFRQFFIHTQRMRNS